MSWDVVWQPGHVNKEGILVMTDGLGVGREIGGCGDLIVPEKLMPLDLHQQSLALHMEGLEGSGVDRKESPGLAVCNNTDCTRAW